MLKQVQPKPLNTRGYLNPQEEIQSPKKTKQKKQKKQKNKNTKKQKKKKKKKKKKKRKPQCNFINQKS